MNKLHDEVVSNQSGRRPTGPLAALVTAIPGAIIAGLLWFYVNKFLPQAGPGLLERQSWPLNNIYVCSAIGAFLAAGSALIAMALQNRRRRSMEAEIGLAGLRYQGSVDRNDLRLTGSLQIFDNWTEGTNYGRGEVGRTSVQMVDVRTVRSSSSMGSGGRRHRGNESTTVNQTVFLLPASERPFPTLSILRKRSSIMAMFGHKGMEFHARNDAASEPDRRTLEEFRTNYLVTQGLVLKSNRAAEDSGEAASLFERMQEMIGLPLLRQLLMTGQWNLEFCPSHVAIWKAKKLIRPNEVAQQLQEVVELHRAILDGCGDHSETRLEVQGSAKMEIDASFGQFIPLAAGGCVGMFLAFVIFLPIFFLFADKHQWIVFLWPVFGMAMMAGCAVAGSRLSRRWHK